MNVEEAFKFWAEQIRKILDGLTK